MTTQQRPPVIGAFTDIFEKVGEQVKSIPKDIGQTALESLGGSSTGKQNQSSSPLPPGSANNPESKYQEMDTLKDQQTKKSIARAALTEISTPKPKELSIWEKFQQEGEQKKEQKDLQLKAAQNTPVLPSSGRSKMPGLKHGIKQKQTAIENKATKSD